MARRNKSNANSSLDLFLDTICNAFGGIVFISILISILAQMQGGSASEEDTPTTSPQKAAAIAQQVTELEAKRAQLIAMIRKTERDQLGGDQSDLLDMLKKLEESQKKLDDVVSQQVKASQKLSDIETENAKLQAEADKIAREISDARAALVAQTKSLDDALDAIEQKVTLPKARTTRKGNVLLAMRYGKLYIVSDLSKADANQLFLQHVDVNKTNNATSIRPKPEAGWPWSDSQSQSRFRSEIAAKRPADNFLTVAVWPDSFDVFGQLKQTIVELGYEYELKPLADVASITINTNSTELPTVQ